MFANKPCASYFLALRTPLFCFRLSRVGGRKVPRALHYPSMFDPIEKCGNFLFCSGIVVISSCYFHSGVASNTRWRRQTAALWERPIDLKPGSQHPTGPLETPHWAPRLSPSAPPGTEGQFNSQRRRRPGSYQI